MMADHSSLVSERCCSYHSAGRLTHFHARCLTSCSKLTKRSQMIHAYGLSDSALEHVSSASKIANEVLAANAAEVDSQGRFPAEGLRALADAGLYGLCLPKDAGGKGEAMRA